jgi:hypothetical protein
MLGVCDFIVLPSTDETQSHTLARIIALNKPFITSAPMEGLTAQTIESGGGLLFTNQQMLREAVIRLGATRGLRHRLGNQLKSYLDEVVSWVSLPAPTTTSTTLPPGQASRQARQPPRSEADRGHKESQPAAPLRGDRAPARRPPRRAGRYHTDTRTHSLALRGS